MENWFKIKGYYHLTPQTSKGEYKKLVKLVKNPYYIANYSFYPLLHTIIRVRRHKKVGDKSCHSYYDENIKKFRRTAKDRPLHYATHMDSLIFSYYAEELQKEYSTSIKNSKLDDCITAYRKIPIDNKDVNSKNKGSIHFAKEVFDEIKYRALKDGDCVVLTFDIESFFSSLDHDLLYLFWGNILGENGLPPDHSNVFKAATSFSFIYKNDLKVKGKKNFDERTIGRNRTRDGVKAFFSSPKEFRNEVKNGNLRVYKNQSKNKETGQFMGIPQGLPISAILANIYLKKFDEEVVSELVQSKNCFYRRYSDDIGIICKKNQVDDVERLIYESIKKYRLSINNLKTDKFLFKRTGDSVNVYKLKDGELLLNRPLIYLGFEFYGNRTLIKSTNLSKFYRRMIYAVKSKSKRAFKIAEVNSSKPRIFINQLKRLYSSENLDKKYSKRRYYKLKRTEFGSYRLIHTEDSKKSGTYFNYVKRASEILEAPEILNQIKGEKRVFNQALKKHFYGKLDH